MVYAPAKFLDALILERTQNDAPENEVSAPVLNPILDTLEAAKRGEIPYRSPLTDEQCAARRAFLAIPQQPTEELIAGLAARRKLGRRTNEI